MSISSIGKAILATIAYCVAIELIGVWIIPFEMLNVRGYHDYYKLVQGLLQMILAYWFIKKVTASALERKFRISPSWLIVSAVAGCAYVFLQTPLFHLYRLVTGLSESSILEQNASINSISINTLSTVLFIPVGEELFFRLFIQNKLLKPLKPIYSILITSLLFASIHLWIMSYFIADTNLNYYQCYVAFFVGLISGILFHKSQSPIPSIIMHCTWNLTVVLI